MTTRNQTRALLKLGIETDSDGVTYNAIIPLIQKQPKNVVAKITNMSWLLSPMILNTPAQLCEALLRSTGKWTDDEH